MVRKDKITREETVGWGKVRLHMQKLFSLSHPSITASRLWCQGDGAEADTPLLTQTLHFFPHTPPRIWKMGENKVPNKAKPRKLVKGSYHFNGSKR